MSASLFSVYSVLLLPICVTISMASCLLAAPIATRLGILDIPGGRKSHIRATPLMGGVVLILGFYPWLLIWILFDPDPGVRSLLPITACSAVITLLGLIDDRTHLSPLLRLVVCFAAIGSTIFLNRELELESISWSYGAGEVSLLGFGVFFSTVAIVALIQAANLADGKNGLLIGLCLGWVFFLGSFGATQYSTALFCVSGVLVVLLIFNLSGKLFLGDGGSYGLATFIGLMALLITKDPTSRVSSDQMGLVFLLPVMDMIRLMLVRVARGQSPFAGDRDHLHHHLLSVFGWPGGLAVYLLLACVPSFAAGGAPRWTLAIVFLTACAYLLVIYGLEAVLVRRRTRQNKARD